MTELRSINPATGEVIWQAEAADDAAIDRVARKARRAFVSWAVAPVDDRRAVLERYRDILTDKKEHLAVTIAKETGKVLWDAHTEVAAMIGKIAISLQAYGERTGRRESATGQIRSVVRYRPHGVVAVLGPYNFPGHLPNGHIVPALLAGNAAVFKPSELTPLVAEETLKCWQAAGLPDGVLQVVQGGGETGAALIGHPEVDGLFFTGSSDTGRRLHRRFGGYPEKILALEMGGNNPLVMWDAKDIAAAAYHVIMSAFITTGQRCTCARRLIIAADKRGDDFLQALLAMVSSVQVGPYTDRPEPFMGPLVSMAERQKMLDAQQQMVDAGGNCLLAMAPIVEDLPFLSPGIIDVTKASERPDREHFGPLLQVIRVPDVEHAIAAANQTAYGLTSAIFTEDEQLYQRFRSQVRTGLVNWNRQTTGASSAAPFGGIGISGNHRPSAYFAADYCAYPVASMETEQLRMPDTLSPGIAPNVGLDIK